MKRYIAKAVGWLTTCAVSTLLIAGLGVAASAPASAATAHCRDAR